MGNTAKSESKKRVTDGSTMKIDLETNGVLAFDANHPIIGSISIDAKQIIPAYALEVTLYCKDRHVIITRDDNGTHV